MRLFGQLEAADGGVAFAVRGAKQRALLALLALHRGEPVSADQLIDALWGDGQAANPVNALQAQIGQLRRTLGAGTIVTTEAGYALAVGPDEVDVVRFEQLVAKGRRLAEQGEMALPSATLAEALGQRRGEPTATASARLAMRTTVTSSTSPLRGPAGYIATATAGGNLLYVIMVHIAAPIGNTDIVHFAAHVPFFLSHHSEP